MPIKKVTRLTPKGLKNFYKVVPPKPKKPPKPKRPKSR